MNLLYGQDLVNELRKLAENVKSRLWIAVPYIGNAVAVKKILGEEWINNKDVSVRLLTDINEQNNFNSGTLKLFYQEGIIRSLVGLHAKIYIVDNKCVITSANLTSTAFSKRHEVGFVLSEEDMNQSITFFEMLWKKSIDVTEKNIGTIINNENNSSEERNGIKLPSLWKLPEKKVKFKYWLKPIGTKENPIPHDKLFNRTTDFMHFAVTPKSVRKNDILIAYGTGTNKLLSVYKVNEKPEIVKNNEVWRERFPWEAEAENLTRNFGKNWFALNFNPFSLVEEYLSENPTGYITNVKGKTLGGINYSKDKIELDENFAEFVIEKMNQNN